MTEWTGVNSIVSVWQKAASDEDVTRLLFEGRNVAAVREFGPLGDLYFPAQMTEYAAHAADDDVDVSDMTEPTSLEDANDNPDEVEDDGLGDTEPEPFDPKDVDEVDE